jgi:hypothetical protein
MEDDDEDDELDNSINQGDSNADERPVGGGNDEGMRMGMFFV